MKALHVLPIAIASLAFAGNNARAADDSNAREHKVSVALMIAYEGEYSENEKNNGDVKFSQKIETEKFANKELLEALVDDGVIDNIKGWSIVVITDDNANIVGTFLTRKNTVPINISGYFDAYPSGPVIEGFSGKYIYSKDTEKGNGSGQALASLYIDVSGFFAEIQGLFMGESTFNDGTEFVKKASFTELTGYAGEGDAIVTGSVKAGKGKKITID